MRFTRKNSPDMQYWVGGHVLCQMLAQVCYKQFYDVEGVDYQEVSLIVNTSDALGICS
jgi:hypothetical protein